MSVMGNISNISKCSLHDGDGVRTVVYFKCCNLRCKWCHNPENLEFSPTMLYAKSKCIHCLRCIKLCPECHRVENDEMIYDRSKCNLCGKCAEVCPSGALVMSGKMITDDEVFKEIKKDQHYYVQSGGGVTLSGGECLLQPEFAEALLKKCKDSSISTAIETALCVPYESILKVLPYTDLFFVDLKHWDFEKHKQYTGQGNELIIENINKLSRTDAKIIIRIPLIPGVNDKIEDMQEFKKIISGFGPGIKETELLKYNYLAQSKYKLSGMEYTSFGDQTQSDKKVQQLYRILEKSTP